VRGEDYPPYRNGLPAYVKLRNVPVAKKLNTAFKI
jgi:6-phosphofructokinase 1